VHHPGDHPDHVRGTDRRRSGLRRHANCYIVKPPTFTELAHAINGIGAFWLDLVTLPPATAAVGQ
jgi:hypothetical protein